MKKSVLLLAALVIGAVVLLYPRFAGNQARIQAAGAKTPEPGLAAAMVVAAGRVEPVSEEVKIGSELDGRLKQVMVDEGGPVRRGQVIAVLDNGDSVARVALAKAELAEKQAALERLLNGTRQEERREARAGIREAEAVLEAASAERERRQTLLQRGAISRSEFSSFDREYQVALARVEAAKERHAVVDAPARNDDRMRAEADIARARAHIQEVEAALEKTVIRSPINGVVLRRYLKTGESVSTNANTPIVSLGDTSRLRVRADIDETDVARIRVGQPAYVMADAYGKQRFAGHVSRIGQALGRKNVRTDEPTERIDTKILETLIDLDPGQQLPVGLRVDTYIPAQ
ncbi:MAG: HlyD family secretion protein [Acidobacteria bacterium]|nr:HlyD family secretion protein [Acidobacteriota bacterium]